MRPLPSIPNPKPQTLKPKPQTPHLKPSSLLQEEFLLLPGKSKAQPKPERKATPLQTFFLFYFPSRTAATPESWKGPPNVNLPGR